ncbi:hypothetical protein Theam_0039 [Thermovibrio ammonificans HB-1]|uniref:PH domain-containing protein n=1 Tax=Thermovibrio ammonificans (strain DSM 15698 / JCM 12110 / HB-1) TaxID=648996 RepID=E8T308_THEA1|nr:hypothetical protein [Thermovibrio ammonificans]ADU96013.1 hypothetical protein Theam_0039 [Thermovibrio ammonificans HB-1]
MWLELNGVLINLDNVKHIERSGRLVVFHYRGDNTPLTVSFESEAVAQGWLEAFALLNKGQKNLISVKALDLN